ncbi:MAG: PQQ-dependent sugar dehydrogenase [Tropicimonas sp.]|uniref:PQQ-dependent sugar dehydrogenase n=1 Tax=Tropicimonas sp. TaxID=2067044 RepID=UPI003A849E75
MRFIAILIVMFCPLTVQAETRQSSAGPLDVTLIADGLRTPWALAFLPDGGFLISERAGTLLRFAADGGSRTKIAGLPEVRSAGQGGLLDVLVPRDFAQSRQVYLSYSRPQAHGAGTAVGVGRLSADGARLEDFRVIFEMAPGSSGGRHFGSRLVEAPDGTLFATIGERGDRPAAQDLSRVHGSVVRIARDGSVPGDNPFAGRDGTRAEIWSFGHRNAQGAALDGEGRLWVTEHGARGGDEVNLIRRGANYGWPVISYGRHYSGAKIGEGTAREGMAQPAWYWDPSIAPSGLAILSDGLFDGWQGDFLAGSLKFDLISRLERQGDALVEAERLEWPETARVRDIREAPDGAIWFLSEDRGAIYRIAPAGK